MSKSLNLVIVKAIRTFIRPRLVCGVEKGFSVIDNGLAVRVDSDSGVVVFRASVWPIWSNIHLLRIPRSDYTVIFESCGSRPERGDARSTGFQVRTDML